MSFPVTFTDQSSPGPSGPITAWDLDFGDGSAHGSGAGPWSNTYATAGTYTATLTVTSADGTASVAHSVILVDAGTATFQTATNWARPAFTALRDVPFTTKAGLDAAVTDMRAGDHIHYAGSGVLTISSSSTYPYSLINKNMSGTVVIDLGTYRSIWDPGSVSGDYVSFSYTGTGFFQSFNLHDCSNIRIYGGELTAPNGGDGGLSIIADTHDVLWWDLTAYLVGGHGLVVKGNNLSGAAGNCYNLDIRAEVDRFCMNPGHDNHVDKGCGFHACSLHGRNGNIYHSRFAIYGHDPLRPGETSVGKVWPEGGGGSCIEIGNDVGTNYTNCTYYALAENMLMRPGNNGGPLNPGSAVNYEVGGNAIEIWGNAPLNSSVIGWVEANNCTGGCTNGGSGHWPASPKITVLHGRGSNTNQFVGGTSHNVAQRYDPRYPQITYTDCT